MVAITEFGRRLKSNNSGGTDHGHGNMMMVLGGRVNGGRMYGQWPGLDNAHLSNQVDLAVTTDYRTVLAEIVGKQYGVKELGTIFPKYPAATKPLGILA